MGETMDFSERFDDTVEGKFDDDDVELDKISEAFICCVCRDLLYKPIVLECGHMCCFWCVHKSMSGLHKSRCPICRNQYFHFPYICQKLHLLLLKLYPSAYKRRENQTSEEEKAMDCFSPQINGPVYQLQSEVAQPKPSDASVPCSSESNPSNNPCVVKVGNTLGSKDHTHFDSVYQEICSATLLDHGKDTKVTGVIGAEDRNFIHTQCNGTCELVSVDDVLCDSCKHILFRPVVLNCGHVFCICCIDTQKNEVLKCQVCESLHPGDIPKVCLEFDHFLEVQFPKEYELRRNASQMQLEQIHKATPSTCCSDLDKESFGFSLSSGDDPLPWWNSNSKVHVGVGCDNCGMFPIIGDRYKCKDCLEKVGYDLCKECYTTSSKLPGRFNQHHTSDHKFEIMKSSDVHTIMLRLLRGQLQEGSVVSNAPQEGSPDVMPPLDDTMEDAENATHATHPPPGPDANQSEN